MPGVSEIWHVVFWETNRLEKYLVCREYRGRGVAGSQLDEEPRPCHFCLLKILYMAQVVQFPFCLFVEVNLCRARRYMCLLWLWRKAKRLLTSQSRPHQLLFCQIPFTEKLPLPQQSNPPQLRFLSLLLPPPSLPCLGPDLEELLAGLLEPEIQFFRFSIMEHLTWQRVSAHTFGIYHVLS